MVLGVERVVIVKVEEEGFLHARIRPLPLPDDSSRETEALALSLVDLGTKFLQLAQGGNVQADIARMFAAEQDPLQLAFMIASVMNLDAAKEQALLETPTRVEGLRMVMGWLSHEVDVLELRNKIANEARTEMTQGAEASTFCASRSAPLSRSWARVARSRPRSSRFANAWKRPTFPKTF